jgi:Zn finger protein HypA/HybF involved in hydrogenase expression
MNLSTKIFVRPDHMLKIIRHTDGRINCAYCKTPIIEPFDNVRFCPKCEG